MKLKQNYVTLHNGKEELLFHAVKHEGKWMHREEWLAETYNNSLPLHEPLKSIIKEAIDEGTLEG